MTTVAPVEIPTTVDQQQLEPPYAVILHNDDVNTMRHVVESLMMCVPDLSHEQAAEIMLEAHSNGQARVIVAPHENARRYRDCLESRGLTATIEPA